MKNFFVIGNPIQHSLSPIVHNYWFHKYQLDFVYDKMKLNEKDLSSIIDQIKAKKILGINITVPFKQKIIPFLDHLSNVAKMTNSVNTVYRQSGKIIGDNTDVYGFEQSLANLDIKNSLKSALILGAGGVTASIIFALKNLGLDHIILSNRTAEKALLLKNKFGTIVSLIAWENLHECKNIDIVINTTSLGLPGTHLDVDFSNLNNETLVYDLIYNPSITKFIKKAKQKGHVTLNGMTMFLYQAQKAFEIWTKIKPEIDEGLTRVVRKNLYD